MTSRREHLIAIADSMANGHFPTLAPFEVEPPREDCVKYTTYHWFHIPSGRFGEREFTPEEYMEGQWDNGLDEAYALRIVNIWNRGNHHDYRYWLA